MHRGARETGVRESLYMAALHIGLGAALVMQFAWMRCFFAVILIATGVKMLVMMDKKPDLSDNPVLRFMRKRLRVTETLHGQSFLVRQPDPRTGKLLLWATPLFLCLVLVEVADLMFALDAVVHRFHYLKHALAMVLVFIGLKMFAGDWLFGGKVPASISLSVTGLLLAGGIAVSLWKMRSGPRGPAV
jgi:tellurite resistance protein TerC